MKNILFKLIFGLFLCSNYAFGQGSSGKTTANIDSVNLIKYKRNEYRGDIMRMAQKKTVETGNVIACKLLPDGYHTGYIPKIDSTKPIDTTLTKKSIQNLPSIPPYSRICGPSRASVMSAEPLYVLKNDNRILQGGIVNLNPKWIEAIVVLKDANTTAKYGSRGTNGVLEITLKEDSVFLSVEKLLSAYKLPKRHSTLPLYINQKPFPKEQLLLQRSSVTDVEIAEELENGAKEKHIEVTTTGK